MGRRHVARGAVVLKHRRLSTVHHGDLLVQTHRGEELRGALCRRPLGIRPRALRSHLFTRCGTSRHRQHRTDGGEERGHGDHLAAQPRGGEATSGRLRALGVTTSHGCSREWLGTDICEERVADGRVSVIAVNWSGCSCPTRGNSSRRRRRSRGTWPRGHWPAASCRHGRWPATRSGCARSPCCWPAP